jgi:hypothetical protein
MAAEHEVTPGVMYHTTWHGVINLTTHNGPVLLHEIDGLDLLECVTWNKTERAGLFKSFDPEYLVVLRESEVYPYTGEYSTLV